MSEAILNVYRHYFKFSGRTSRRDYWLFEILSFIMRIVFVICLFTVFPALFEWFIIEPESTEYNIAYLCLIGIHLALFELPKISLTIRRLHDANLSGVFWLLVFIGAVGGIVVLILCSLKGTIGANQFGEEPKEDPYEEMHNLLEVLIDQWKTVHPDAKVSQSLNVEKVAKSIIKYDKEHGENTTLSDKMEEVLERIV